MCEGKDTKYRYKGQFFDKPIFWILKDLKKLLVLIMDVIIGLSCSAYGLYIVIWKMRLDIGSIEVTNGLLLLIIGNYLIINAHKGVEK